MQLLCKINTVVSAYLAQQKLAQVITVPYVTVTWPGCLAVGLFILHDWGLQLEFLDMLMDVVA